MPVPFLDLPAQLQRIRPDVDAAVAGVLDSARFVLGQENEAFEREFAAYCGVRHAVAVNTGTSALHLALRALGVGQERGRQDEVVTVPFTFVATAAAAVYCGARPVYVDVDPATLTMDPERLEAAITPRTRAIVPVHLYGQPADMGPILDIAARYGIPVLEDACQAHGAEDRGRRVGSLGAAAAFSFYPGKNLGAAGEGGAVTTNDNALAARLRLLRDWGAAHKYDHELLGFNNRMDEMQAAILRVKLGQLDRWTEERRERAARYRRDLAGGPEEPVAERADVRHVYHLFVVRTPHRQHLQRVLDRAGIGNGVHYPIPVHLQPPYRFGYQPGDFPVSERAAREVLSLPMFPELTAAQQDAVVAALDPRTNAAREGQVRDYSALAAI
jgi:dTDP-4-amino-4,6-dideoxygalactose transaminase